MNDIKLKYVFEKIVGDLSWPLVISNINGKFLFANQLYQKLRGIELSLLQNKFWWDVTSGLSEERFEKERLKQIKKKKKFTSIVEYWHKDIGKTKIKWESELVDSPDTKQTTVIIEKGKIITSESNDFKEINLKQKEFNKILFEKFDIILDSITGFGGIVKDFMISDQLKNNISEKLENLSVSKNELLNLDIQDSDEISKKMINLDFLISEIKQYVISRNDQEISIQVDSETKKYMVFANYSQIYEALLRLIIIACKFAQIDKKVKIVNTILNNYKEERIDDTFLKSGKYIQIKIEYFPDNNTNALNNKIFEPFMDNFKNLKGDKKIYEMIFPLIYRTIKKHGGYIFFKAITNKLNCFEVLLPTILMTDGEKADNKNKNRIDKIKKDKHSVLIVDCESDSANNLESLLISMGFLVETANDSEIALEKYFKSEIKPQLLIIDPYIPINKGINLIKKLKELNPKIKIIIISNYMKDEIQDQIQKLEF